MKDYKAVWDNLSTNFGDASYYVCCIEDESGIRSNGQLTSEFLHSVLQIQPTDRVLEIGCGVARIGRELAPKCGEWFGVDISGNMIEYAKKRTSDLPNVSLYELPANDLSIFSDNSFDCVYCTIVFMHLDKPDMFTYICEALRVLKPGGRAYFDTYNILAPGAWEEFLKVVSAFPSNQRPGHVSQFSTPQELGKFMEEAGFSTIHIDDRNPQLVVALGQKPPQLEGEEVALAQSPLAGPTTLPRSATDDTPIVTLASLESALDALRSEMLTQSEYANLLEQEIARKNTALADLESRLRKREKQLVAARRPRLPWKH